MKATLGKAINKIFNRLTITVALILVQVGWFAVLLLKLADYASWISVLFTVLAEMCIRDSLRFDSGVYRRRTHH